MQFAIIIWLFLSVISKVQAERYIKSTSLLTCMENSGFTASFFDVTFYPGNNTIYFDISAISTLNTYVGANVQVIAYGINIISRNLTLCSMGFSTICPLTATHLDLSSSYQIEDSITNQIPGIAYTIPDLDARVQVILYDTNTTDLVSVACVEAVLSNGKTVQTKYAAWPIAAISGLGLITSGVISVIGHSNTAAHIASNSMSLFIYFQSLAITSMMAVSRVPPIAAAWAENFQWSLGIVKFKVIQDISNWYVQATGGTPTGVLANSYLSVSVQKLAKRTNVVESFLSSLESLLLDKSRSSLFKRSADFSYDYDLNATLYTTDEKDADVSSKILVLRGIQRVAYLAGIEITNVFMTGIIFFFFFGFIVLIILTSFKAILEILVRAKMMNEGKLSEYRSQWSSIIKGSLYRLALVAFPQIGVLCFWELIERDSAGAVVIAVFLLAVTLVLLFQAAFRVVWLGRSSVRMYKNPAYLLFGDASFLNRFGFIYVQYRADRYYFVAVGLFYTLLRSIFIALMQEYGKIQSVLVFVVELVYFVALCWLRPYMDKRTNAFNITISLINTLNSIFYMFFSDLFGQPHVVSSVMAVVLFVLNAVFSLFLLIFTIVTCVLALLYKNPDTRYQPMKDDRVSFIPRVDNPSQNRNSDMELMALGATAMRGHENLPAKDFQQSDSDENLPQKAMPYDKLSGNNNKRDSVSSYMDEIQPTELNSTITGNPSAALRKPDSSYDTAYDGYYNQNNSSSVRWG